jgi:hypothetical protein
MKNLIISSLLVLMAFGCKEKTKEIIEEKTTENVSETISKKVDQEEWTVLFDGTSFDGWHGFGSSKMPIEWKLEEGAMVFYPPKERVKNKVYDILTDKEYTDFVLSIEWKISEGGNSGIFWGINEGGKYNVPYQTGPEIQVLDNLKHPDAKNGTTHRAGALYDLVAPSKDVVKPVGEWNLCVITVNHKTNTGKVVLNGEEIVGFPTQGDHWNTLVAKSKFADWDGFGAFSTGKIGLQDHGDIVSFRNIKIKEL